MDTLPRLFLATRFLLLCFAALLVANVAAAQQVLSVSPNPSTPISVTATAGTNAASQTVRISNAGRGALKWTVTQPPPPGNSWLSVSPTSGVNNGTLTLTFNTSTLPVSSTPYQTTFGINSNGGSATITVRVTIVAATTQTLTVTCPGNMTVFSSDGSPVVVTYTATTSGGQQPVTVTYTPASGSMFSVGTASVTVNAHSADNQNASCGFSVTVKWTLVVTCPSNISATSSDNNPVPVTYTVTLSGGQSPTWSGVPASGSNFPVGSTPVSVTAQSGDGQTANCGFFVNVTYTPPSSTGVGPQTSITCPSSGVVNILPGTNNIQTLVDANLPGTTFCLKPGTFHMTSSITPKPGDTFLGEYGAILDGTGWTTTDDSQAAFRVYDDPNDPNDPTTDVGNVTIKNLVIRNMPQYGIHGSYTRRADHWTVQNNEIASNKSGVLFTSNSVITNNYIHHNVGNPSSPNPGERGGGYVGQFADNTIVDNNEIASNGPEQKVHSSTNVKFRNNFVHHNVRDGIWYDFNQNAVALIQGNRIEDNGGNGITFEISIGGTIANNTLRRNGEDAVLITVSQNAQIHDNLLEANLGGIEYFLNCGSFAEGMDLQNNAAYDNTIVIGTQSNPWASAFSYLSQCTAQQLTPYLDGTKNNTFSHNTYHVPSLSFTRYFLWGGWKDWTTWRQLSPGHDQDSNMVSP